MNTLPTEIVKENAIIPKGSWVISFELTLFMKDAKVTIIRFVTDKRNPIEAIAQKIIIESMVSDYIKENYHDSAVDVVEVKNIRIKNSKAVGMKKIAMKGQHLHYKLIPDELNININQEQCCLDYIMFEMAKVWKTYTRQQLIQELGKECVFVGVTTERLLQWASSKKYISVFALDPFGNVFNSILACGHTSLVLAFVVNNDHCYPITDELLKRSIS